MTPPATAAMAATSDLSKVAATDPVRSTKAFHLVSLDTATAALDKVEAGATSILEQKEVEAGLDKMEAAVGRHFDATGGVAE